MSLTKMAKLSSSIADLTCCNICLKTFTRPKMLPCQHTYCYCCLLSLCSDEAQARIACPQCREIHHIPNGAISEFRDNIMVNNLLEVGVTSEEILCSDCGLKPSIYECEHCDSDVCGPCLSGHSIKLLMELERSLKDVKKTMAMSRSNDKKEKLKISKEAWREQLHALKNSRKRKLQELVQLYRDSASLEKFMGIIGRIFDDLLLETEESDDSYCTFLSQKMEECTTIQSLNDIRGSVSDVKTVLQLLQSTDDDVRFVSEQDSNILGHIAIGQSVLNVQGKYESDIEEEDIFELFPGLREKFVHKSAGHDATTAEDLKIVADEDALNIETTSEMKSGLLTSDGAGADNDVNNQEEQCDEAIQRKSRTLPQQLSTDESMTMRVGRRKKRFKAEEAATAKAKKEAERRAKAAELDRAKKDEEDRARARKKEADRRDKEAKKKVEDKKVKEATEDRARKEADGRNVKDMPAAKAKKEAEERKAKDAIEAIAKKESEEKKTKEMMEAETNKEAEKHNNLVLLGEHEVEAEATKRREEEEAREEAEAVAELKAMREVEAKITAERKRAIEEEAKAHDKTRKADRQNIPVQVKEFETECEMLAEAMKLNKDHDVKAIKMAGDTTKAKVKLVEDADVKPRKDKDREIKKMPNGEVNFEAEVSKVTVSATLTQWSDSSHSERTRCQARTLPCTAEDTGQKSSTSNAPDEDDVRHRMYFSETPPFTEHIFSDNVSHEKEMQAFQYTAEEAAAGDDVPIARVAPPEHSFTDNVSGSCEQRSSDRQTSGDHHTDSDDDRIEMEDIFSFDDDGDKNFYSEIPDHSSYIEKETVFASKPESKEFASYDPAENEKAYDTSPVDSDSDMEDMEIEDCFLFESHEEKIVWNQSLGH